MGLLHTATDEFPSLPPGEAGPGSDGSPDAAAEVGQHAQWRPVPGVRHADLRAVRRCHGTDYARHSSTTDGATVAGALRGHAAE